MYTTEDEKKILIYYQSRIAHCKKCAEISADALKSPVDGSVDTAEFIRRRNLETLGEDTFADLQRGFSVLRTIYEKSGCSEAVLNYIAEEIGRINPVANQ